MAAATCGLYVKAVLKSSFDNPEEITDNVLVNNKTTDIVKILILNYDMH